MYSTLTRTRIILQKDSPKTKVCYDVFGVDLMLDHVLLWTKLLQPVGAN